MLIEPDYIAQNGEDLTQDEALAWFRRRAADAHLNHGCTGFRYSTHDTIPHLILIEGWTKLPADRGEPRWQMAKAA